jgi:pyridoxine 5-phosphate synthase
MNGVNLKLGVNIDHVATLRQARGTSYPDVVDAARVCEAAGAHGITVHLREDRRHIQDADVYALRGAIRTRLNLEMANAPEIVDVAVDVKPDEVCLVPEKREELTTEGGLDVAGQADALRDTVRTLSDAGIVVSLFIDPDLPQVDACADIGAPVVELHTGRFCEATGSAAANELERLVVGAVCAHEKGLQVNAGHGLNRHNIEAILDVPHLDTLNIGHSIVAEAVFCGLDKAVKAMLTRLAAYGGGRNA